MTNIALKEWSVAVHAMEAGQQNVIFRKGGIQEPEGDFQLTHTHFLLYPAREHQKEEYLKSQFKELFQKTKAAQTGHTVEITSQARVLKTHHIHTIQEAAAYHDRHIWTEDFIQMRLDYKPDRPLYVIELAIESLEKSIFFTERTEYAGCKSWVELTAADLHSFAE